MNINKYLSFNREVQDAINNHKPIVALESTIICHGMPYPENVQNALECEEIIRSLGVVPATIAIINGRLKIGLEKDEIDYLGKQGPKIIKTSKRDIAYIVSNKLDGATTVAATIIIANFANIKIFATGGIGGVHRDVEKTMDISNDLEEISKNNVSVVCSGVKSILDLSKTLEYLETKGVLIVGYQTNILPAFYTSESPYYVDQRVDNPQDIALLINTKDNLGLEGGIIITNPVPKQYEQNSCLINEAIDKALLEMKKQGITGKKTTPFLLSKIADLTKGFSLQSNIKLIQNNCLLAAQIAKELEANK